MKAAVVIVVLVVIIVAVTGILHLLVLGAIGAAIFALGYGTGRASATLSSAERRHLGGP